MHDRISVNALCFPGASLGDMEAHWRQLRPHRISFMSWLLEDIAEARRIIADGGYRMEGMTHLFFNGGAIQTDAAAVAAERDRLHRAIDAMAEIGGRSIYMMTGGRGAMGWEDAAARFSEAIAPSVEQAKAAGLGLMIETTSPFYADGHLAHTLVDTLTLAEMAGLGVCIDIYACWTEAGLEQTIQRAAPRCGLVQVSDYVYGDRSLPSRAVPGDGAIPLRRIIGWLLDAGYEGAFDLELIGPRIDAEGHVNAVARAADVVSTYLES